MRSIPAVVPRFTAGGVRHRGGTVEIEAAAGDASGCRGQVGVSTIVGLHVEDWEHFSEGRADLEAAFAGSGLLVPTPRGERVVLP
jgi:hypothetical protein